ncbi:MAG: hypothetical protein K6T85_17480 [Gorillibacterium sp.]|nr:hypothetical protein [Gorillibacterium sp.]
MPVNAAKSTEAKLVADKADTKFANFYVKQGRLFYHTLRNGKTWVVTKVAAGSGQLQWIASGKLPYKELTIDNTSFYLTVNTKPEITETSENCMVLYTLPLKGGVPKAINAKYPLALNWADSGAWLSGYYFYNKNIEVDLEGAYDYTTGLGFVLGMNSKAFQLHKTGIVEAVSVDATKIAFSDVDGKAYVSTIKDSKVISTKTLPFTDTYFLRNLYSKGKVSATLFFTKSAVYKLLPDLSVKKIVATEWSQFVTDKEIPGFFYTNTVDDNKLYWSSEDGKTNKNLNTDTVDDLLVVSQQ